MKNGKGTAVLWHYADDVLLVAFYDRPQAVLQRSATTLQETTLKGTTLQSTW